ncbi:MAG: ankyrin repeat domain-containing protein, partial [Acidobacteriota bacterium]|nr:ankyrin repeat domain-containing protein [Acidobacteriota bacterium]
PLIAAVRDGDMEGVRTLIDEGADPNMRAGVNAWTPLMHAVHKHQTGSAIALLKGGAAIDATMQDGKTALMMAAGYGHADMVRVLLDRGADAHLKTRSGETALTFAVLGSTDIDEFTLGKCRTQTVRLLLDRAPNLKLQGHVADWAARWLSKHSGCGEVLAMVR